MSKIKRLTHHFLIPSAQMSDDRFVDSVIYVCRHTIEGAWGFVINRPLPYSVGGLLSELGLPIIGSAMNVSALDGGPVRPEAGFVLHTGQPEYKSSFAIFENICLTTSKDVLQRLAFGELRHYLLCMGYCSWGKDQLDDEIASGDWYICPADLSTLFYVPFDERLRVCYNKLGINPDRMVATFGYA